MPRSLGLPPVVACRGTRPSQAARSRPRAKVRAFPTAATKAIKFNGPDPRDRQQPAHVRLCLGRRGKFGIEALDPLVQGSPLLPHVDNQDVNARGKNRCLAVQQVRQAPPSIWPDLAARRDRVTGSRLRIWFISDVPLPTR